MKYADYQRSKDRESHVDEIHELAVRMKHAGREMGLELSRQQGVITQLDNELQLTQGTLENLNSEVGELLETQGTVVAI